MKLKGGIGGKIEEKEEVKRNLERKMVVRMKDIFFNGRRKRKVGGNRTEQVKEEEGEKKIGNIRVTSRETHFMEGR